MYDNTSWVLVERVVCVSLSTFIAAFGVWDLLSIFQEIHTAQALYLTDNNKYAANVDTLNITISPDALYNYGKDPTSTDKSVHLSAEKVEFRVLAIAKNKLASCAVGLATAKDTWCLNHDKILTNIKINNPGLGTARPAGSNGATAFCGTAAHTVYGGCENGFQN